MPAAGYLGREPPQFAGGDRCMRGGGPVRRLAVLRFAAAAFSDGIERAAPVDASETADGWVEAMTALPRLWLLTGHRAGDNNQLLALA